MTKFNVVEHENAFHEDLMCIKITEGDYEGVVFQYDNIRLEEDKDEDASISFNFITVDNPEELDLTAKPFIDMLGEIMNELLRSFVENADRTTGAEASSE